MKATIHGITYEGSEDEIRRIAENPPKPPKPEWTCETTTSGPTDTAGTKGMIAVNRMFCGLGRSKDNCEHCKRGYCTASVLASIPPQYQRCVFAAPGVPPYAKCADVD